MDSKISPSDWYLHMRNSTDYLGIEQMQAGMAYSIWARQAYVGIWIPEKQGFLLSRYKLRTTPYLFVEYHWDTGEPHGTAKPLRALEICPLALLPPGSSFPDKEQNDLLCAWLDALEERHPPLPGWDSVGERRRSVVQWLTRQKENRERAAKFVGPVIPVHKWEQIFKFVGPEIPVHMGEQIADSLERG